jgi:hypothetical protein
MNWDECDKKRWFYFLIYQKVWHQASPGVRRHGRYVSIPQSAGYTLSSFDRKGPMLLSDLEAESFQNSYMATSKVLDLVMYRQVYANGAWAWDNRPNLMACNPFPGSVIAGTIAIEDELRAKLPEV